MTIVQLRKEYHAEIFRTVLRVNKKGIPNNADGNNNPSKLLARGIVERIGLAPGNEMSQDVQKTGRAFEKATSRFIEQCFSRLAHVRPGEWRFSVGGKIRHFEQYNHLKAIADALKKDPALRAAINDYIVTPDIVISREPLTDDEINRPRRIVGKGSAVSLTPLRRCNSAESLLHASVSCKWTLRSDRSQNARTEGLNLIRNRKGKTPHIVVVTGEPTPSRIALHRFWHRRCGLRLSLCAS